MTGAIKSIKNFSLQWILPLIDVLLFSLAIYTAIIKLPLWVIVEPGSNSMVHHLLSLIFLSHVQVHINFGWLNIFIPRVLLIGCLIILALKNKYLRQPRFWLASLPLLGIILVNAISRFWSISSATSLSRYLYFSAAIVGGLYIGLEFSKSKMRWLFEVFSVLVVLGILYTVYRQPEFGIMSAPDAGAWRGPFWWKSYAGEMTAFAAIMFLFRMVDFKKNRWFVTVYGVIFYLLSIFLLIKAKSVTELLALIAAHFVIALALAYLKWGHLLKPSHWWLLGLVSVVLLVAAWFGRGFIFGTIGRDADLTGRLPLWNALIPFIQKRFWLGYGFGESFWKNPDYRQVVWTAISWEAPYAHNGFIEALLDTGIVGLGLWLLFIVQVTSLSFKYVSLMRTFSSLIFPAWITFVIVSNLADNMLGSYEYFTVLLLAITFSLLIRDRIDRKQTPAIPSGPPSSPL